MPAAARVGPDGSTGHESYLPRPAATSGSGDVFINQKPALRVGDPWPEHTDPVPRNKPHHPATQKDGSATVFVNGKALARIGDKLSDNDAVAGGSSDVICG